MARQRFVYGIGGTLRFLPPEAVKDGVPTVATVTLKRASGLDLPTPVADAAVTAIDAVSGELSYALSGAQCPDPLTTEPLYRAAWRYTIAGVVYEADQLYEVRRRVLRSTLTRTEMDAELPAPLADLEEDAETVWTTMDSAWDDVLDELAARGYDPDRVMDADRLRRPHRVKVLARLSGTWGPAWRQYHLDREAEFQRVLDRGLSSGGWYDVYEDQKKGPEETKVPSVRLTR